MTRTTRAIGLGATALAAAALAVPAIAADTKTITIKGGPSVKPGKSMSDNQRFTPLAGSVKSGSTITIANKAKSEDPHSFSLVKASDLPKTVAAMNKCFQGGVCNDFFVAHEVPEGDGPPGKPVVNVGADGFDQAGDSVVISPPGAPGSTAKVKITAKKGTTLSYLCAVHPWMQGKIKVK